MLLQQACIKNIYFPFLTYKTFYVSYCYYFFIERNAGNTSDDKEIQQIKFLSFNEAGSKYYVA